MKVFRILIPLFLLSLGLSLFILVQEKVFSFPWQGQRSSEVYSVLIESSEASLLNTAEYRMKLLFPYDFVEKDEEVDWRYLQGYYNYAREDFPRKCSPEFYPDRQLPPRWKYGSLYLLCRENGFDPAKDGSFLVLSVQAKAGFDFQDRALSLLPSKGDEKRIRFSLPRAEITDIIIEDRAARGPSYPEVNMKPREWSRFIEALSPVIYELAVEKGVLELAEDSASALLMDLFEGAGYTVEGIHYEE